MQLRCHLLIFNAELKFMAKGSPNELKTNKVFSFIYIVVINNISRCITTIEFRSQL